MYHRCLTSRPPSSTPSPAAPIFLADGHHRYEAALRYRRSRPDAQQSDDLAASNYVMMTLVEFDDPGLLLLPYHRVAGGMSAEQLDAVRAKMGEYFEARPLNPATSHHQRPSPRLPVSATTAHCFAVFWTDAPRRPSTPCVPKLTGPPGAPWQYPRPGYCRNACCRRCLGDSLAQCIDYSPDHEGIVQQVNVGEQQAAILLKPFPLEPFRQIVSAGNRLPPKSTFFYPKLPTGLVINQLSGSI